MQWFSRRHSLPGPRSQSAGLCTPPRRYLNRSSFPYAELVDAIDTSRKVLAHAAAQIGVEALAERLRISTRTLHEYLTGGALIPDDVFLRAVDVIVERLPELAN